MRNVVLGGLMAVALLWSPGVGDAATSETYRQLNLFGDVFERVRADYVEEVSDKELIEAAINGMLTSLDPHSSYLNPERFQEMQVQTKGEFGGLGIEVTMENGLVRVVSPIDDTPAFDAGIKAGDYITRLDGEQVLGMTLSEAVDRMRGPVGSDIALTIRRKDVKDPIEVTITRAVIKILSVRTRTEGSVIYLRVTSFNENTEREVKRQFAKRETEIDGDFTGVVLDLRNNPGGLLDQAVAVSDLFIEKGKIVSTRGRRSDSIQRFNARAGDIGKGRPVVVLINGGSASASEIVAGALQDHRRALVLGTKSFGKGSVQTIIPLAGRGAIRLTTARYYTPSGRSIQAKGIEPDIRVPQAKVETVDKGRGRDEASLRNRLKSEDELNGNTGAEKVGEPANGRSEAARDDYQLSRALDLLRGIALFEGKVLN